MSNAYPFVSLVICILWRPAWHAMNGLHDGLWGGASSGRLGFQTALLLTAVSAHGFSSCGFEVSGLCRKSFAFRRLNNFSFGWGKSLGAHDEGFS